MTAYYLDTNIFLNVIYREEGFYEKSRDLLQKIHDHEYQALTSSITLLEVLLDMAESGFAELTDKALASIEDIQNLDLVSLDNVMTKQAAAYVIGDNLTIHDAYHLSTALCRKAKAFITRDGDLQKKIKRYIKTITPEEASNHHSRIRA